MAPADQTSPRLIPGLTGLRGVGAMWAALYHMPFISPLPVFNAGYLAVDMFFVLSGFVLAHTHADKPIRTWRDYATFVRTRLARIYPLHLSMLAVLVVFVLLLPGFLEPYTQTTERFGAAALFGNLLLIQNWWHFLPTSWNAPSWSISAEWFVYLLFPIFMSATQRWKSATVPAMLAAAMLALFAAGLTIRGLHTSGVVGFSGLFRVSFEFACGALLYRSLRNGLRLRVVPTELACVVLLAIALSNQSWALAALPGLALLVSCAAQDESRIAKALSSRTMYFLGDISYSIYLVHWPIIQLANWVVEPDMLPIRLRVAWFSAGVLGIGATAVVTNRLIEVPGRRWARSLGSRGMMRRLASRSG